MPNYVFSKVGNSSVIKEFFYHMNEAPKIGSIIKDESGAEWKRVATKPQASIDTAVDPYSAKEFSKATNKKGTLGDLWDRSAELQAKREDKEGQGNDPIQKKFFDNYAARRKGRRHPEELRRKAAKGLEGKGVKIEWGDD